MKNVLGEALTLSNAGNWRETYRNAAGMYQQMNVVGGEKKALPGACLITYCIFVVGTKKKLQCKHKIVPTMQCFGTEKGAGCRQLVNLSSVLKLQCS